MHKNNVGFIDNCTTFKGNSDLSGQDSIDPIQEGAAFISCNRAHSVIIQPNWGQSTVEAQQT